MMKLKYYKPAAYKKKAGFKRFKKGWNSSSKDTYLLHTPFGHFWLWLSMDDYLNWPNQA